MHHKTLQELTIKDGFLFAEVMLDAENCRLLLERILEFPIDHVTVDREKMLQQHPDYHGVRLDVYAKNADNTRFNVEMQVEKQPVEKRARYYHSQIDTDLLAPGNSYETLPDCFVIFICDFDPFGLGKYRYTLKRVFQEDETYDYRDGSYTVFLSTKGNNKNEVSPELQSFLHFVGTNLENAEADFGDSYVRTLQEFIRKVKQDKEAGERYMHLQEMMKKEYDTGFQEGEIRGTITAIVQVLSTRGTVPDELALQLSKISDYETANSLFSLVLSSSSVDEFIEKANL